MVEDKITARKREVGGELRRVREAAGYNGQDLARRLGWSPTKVSRLETGSRQISEVDAAVYLATCGVTHDELNRILDLVRDAGHDHRLQSHGEKLPDELRTLIFHETTAATIESYELVFISGLLQTEDYARALLTEGGRFAADGIELHVNARVDRQHLLRRPNAPGCTFYLHEHVLQTPVGGPKVMQEQMLHLVFLSSWDRCRIRVVPANSGSLGLTHTSFRLMSYAEHGPVAYVEQDVASLFLDRKEHTDEYRKLLKRVASVALDEGESRRLLADLASEWERALEGQDARAQLAQEQS